MVLHGLRAVLEPEPDLEVIGEATDGQSALRLVLQLRPDVLVLDILMPGMNGMELTRQVAQQAPETRIVIFSMHANDAYVRETQVNGAQAYVLKDAGAQELVQAVRAALDGERYLSPALTRRAMDLYLQTPVTNSASWEDLLTGRERQVLQLLARGATNAEIGEQLQISARTAETHRANVMRKLGLKTQTDLIRYVLQHRLGDATSS